jgi:MFS superfamily sulfate permease-like transporter
MRLGGNDFSVREAAGAFGDLGTLVPFVVGYVTITGMDPAGVLVGFGLFNILAGAVFRTPMAIQPMKAIGTAAITHPGAIAPGAVWTAGIFTGLLWLVMGFSGAATWLARITRRPVVHGLVVGLGLSFIGEGLRLLEKDLLLGIAAFVVTFAMLGRGRVPAMLVLLGLGVLVAMVRAPSLLDSVLLVRPSFRLPDLGVPALIWSDVVTGVLVLGLPQAALTLGNAIIATVDENNTLFPDRATTVRTVAVGHGVMNLVSAPLGGVPMCNGAGGMAGHVRFGARTGGALIILGVIVLALGLFFADSVASLFALVPAAILGTILTFGGLELAASVHALDGPKEARYVIVLTAAVAMWNMGAAYAVGMATAYAFERGWLRV